MLAKLAPEIPDEPGWLYEPKWDGFRAIVFRDGADLHIASRDRRALERYFPELLAPLGAALPERCVVDGEVVVASPEGLDFDSLLLRIHPAESRVRKLSQEIPASFVAFDVLALGSADITSHPATERRQELTMSLPQASAEAPPPPLSVTATPQTTDISLAREWFEGLEAFGLDGLIAKRSTSVYSPGKRTMIKIKHRRVADCVVGGYRLNKSRDGVGSLLLGLFDETGSLHYIGHTSSFKAAERRALLERLSELHGESGFGRGRTPGGPSRWTGSQADTWVPVRPELVCEVSYDYVQGARFRHAATFIRWRDDKTPQECGFDQLDVRLGK